jgi:hypothetical protein
MTAARRKELKVPPQHLNSGKAPVGTLQFLMIEAARTLGFAARFIRVPAGSSSIRPMESLETEI